MVPVYLLILLLTTTSYSYFTYQDCALKCRLNRQPCLIIKTLGNQFTSLCVDRDPCESQADSEAPCVQLDHPTSGGQSLWPQFRDRYIPPKPTPKPCPAPKTSSCTGWKIMSITQTTMSITSLITIRILRFLRFRATISYEPINDQVIDNTESPYQSTVQDLADQPIAVEPGSPVDETTENQ